MRARWAVLAAMASALAFVGGAGGGTLHNRVDYPLGQLDPYGIATGDLNGDGKPDLVVANHNSNTVSVLLGNGDGTFTVKAHYATSSVPFSVAIGDLNGDGKPDLAVANLYSDSVSVLLGNGDGSFQAKSDYATGPYPISVAIGDLNGDGKPDLAVANDGANSVSVLQGNGDGTFGAHTDYATGSGPWSVAIGDLNGDGKPDLAVANSVSHSVSVLQGNGDGTFGTHSDYAAGTYPTSVAIGDLNGDGKRDLVLANNAASNVSVLLGNGDGTFGAHTEYATGMNPISVAIGDLNGDGKADLAVANNGSNSVSVLQGNGDGTFGAHADYATGRYPRSVVIGDLNGDGKADLAVANDISNSVSVFLADGTPPTVSCEQPDGVWHAANATISCTASDDFSGLANAADANFSLTTNVGAGSETANASTSSHTVCDQNNNCTTAGPIWGNKVDRAAPTIKMLSMSDGDVYAQGSIHRAIFGCVDPGSGVAVCGADQPSGTRIDTNHEGPGEFEVTAIDNVGNVSQLTVHYTVMALPAPTTLAPASGIAGATVTVNGTHLENVTSAYFTDTRGAQTVFADIVGTPTKTKLQVQVPREAATGPINLLNAAGSSLTGKFTVKPYVSSLDPNQGVVGVAVEVDGGGFVPGSTTVKFGGVASTNVSAFFPSLLIATVPNGAHTGAVTVTTPYGTATGPSFKVLPTASAVSATAARVGSALTVSGTGLTDLRSVTFRGVDRPVRASYVRISSTQLRVVVPNGARTGAATVTTAGGSAQTPVITITG